MTVQKNVNLYEAYASIYVSQEEVVEEVEELDEEPKGLPYGPVGKGFKKLPAGPKRNKMMKREKDYTKKAMDYASREGEAAGEDRQKMGRISSALTNPRLREETDLFDTILEHLVAEGYADTNEAALVIMTNMSEEWRQSIVETFWYGRSGFNPPVVQQRRLGPEVGASGGLSVLAKKNGVEGMQQLMPPGQGKDKWHPGKWTPEGRKRYEDQKNKSPNLIGRIVNTVYKDK